MPSPFLVFQNFITPTEAKQLAEAVRVPFNQDNEGVSLPMIRTYKPGEELLLNRIKPHLQEIIENYDGLKYKGIETPIFYHWPTSASSKPIEEPHCDNAAYKRKKWVRTHGRDLTCLIWLKDYEEHPPFDPLDHVYGGKLEFPLYGFGLQPQAGTMVVFPSNERFIQATLPVFVGELQLIKMFIHGDGIWVYDPAKYTGSYQDWFVNVV
jgi:hypothetical protein